LVRALLFIVALLAACVPAIAAADNRITHAEIVYTEDGHVLNADFELDLNPLLTDALDHGVALHFVIEIRIERPRWYWFDMAVSERRLEYRLTYHALTRSYRLSTGSLHRSFTTLSEALNTLQHIRNWPVANAGELKPGVPHEVELRLRHDTSLLPGPFQLSAVANGEWDVDTGWLQWTFLPEAVTSR
jgi:hypothetical protein